jgi:hypothetical protein
VEDRGLVIEAIYNDPDLVELYVGASNPSFRGEASVYAGVNEVEEMAAQLVGFPKSVHDRQLCSWGDLVGDSGLGGAAFEFLCVDGLGHTGVWVQLRSSDCDAVMTAQTARVFVAFEAADLDRFVQELRVISRTKQGVARLGGGPTTGCS